VALSRFDEARPKTIDLFLPDFTGGGGQVGKPGAELE
jgi:hypothetical protein